MVRILQRALLLGAIIIAVTLAAGVAAQQQNPKRLILKDGSYQSVTKWEVTGNKVRYYSAERFMWEEIPNDLIDWLATNKYNQEREADRKIKTTPDQQSEAEVEPENPETPQIAPGLRLPDGGGVFLFDTFQSQPQLLQLAQNGGELNKHMGKNILRAAINPMALSSKQTVDLKGEKAKVQSHVPQPSIFVNVDTSPLFPQEQATRAKP